MAGLTPVLQTKMAGVEGSFEQLLVKARFEEAKIRDLAISQGRRQKITTTDASNQGRSDPHPGGGRQGGGGQSQQAKLVLDQVIIDVLSAKELGILPGVAHLEEEIHQWRLEEQVRLQQKVVLTGLPVLRQQTYKRTV